MLARFSPGYLTGGRQIIAYHYPCPDGIFAALAAKLRLDQEGIKKTCFVPHKVYQLYDFDTLKIQTNDTVYLLDYVGPAGLAQQAAKQAGRVIILDHHKTAMETLGGSNRHLQNLEVNIDLNQSGATLALAYFQPELSETQKKLFLYIEDADLWKWELPDSKAFHAGFATLGLSFDANSNPQIFSQLLSLSPAAVIAKGKEVLKVNDRLVADAMAEAFVINLGGAVGRQRGWGQALAIHASPALSRIRSQVGNALAAEAEQRGLRAMGAVAYVEAEMNDPFKIKVSLRSLKDEDTTVISEEYGGGGHKNASSCIVSVFEFDLWKAP